MRSFLISFEENEDLPELFDNLSGGNVRRALALLEATVGSPHVKTRAILEASERGEPYYVPLHQMLAAIIYGENRFYYPPASPVCNAFDISTADGREHFLLPMLLAHIERAGNEGGQEGYVPSEGLYRFAQDLGFDPIQIDFQVTRALDKELIELVQKGGREPLASRFRLTTIGAYTLRRLLSSFVYMDAMAVDTPIVDPAAAPGIVDVRRLEERLARADALREYLDQQWDAVSEVTALFDWSTESERLRRETLRIRRRLEAAAAHERGT
jgi:hypothetical protein